jgi:hypothetical protein
VGRIKQLLGVVVEKTRELELELDVDDVGPLERGRIEITPPVPSLPGPLTPDPITLGRLLGWLQEQSGQHLPRLLDASGALARDSIIDTLTAQRSYVQALPILGTFPFTHPIVKRLVEDLDRFLTEAIDEAEAL